MKNTGRPYYISFSSPEQSDYEILNEFDHDLFEMSLERYINDYQVFLVGNRVTKCITFKSCEKAKDFYDMKIMELTQIFKDWEI
nr:MAG TPA: hypothetical protein [Caudoviricetes sp.]